MYKLTATLEADRLKRLLDTGVQNFGPKIADALNITAYEVESKAKPNAPVGVTNSLRSSINTNRASASDLQAKVGTNVQYARAVESGSRPHMPNVEHLKRWAAVKLGDPKLAWAVAMKIKRSGTKGQFYMKKALQSVQAAGTLGKEVAKAVSAILGGK